MMLAVAALAATNHPAAAVAASKPEEQEGYHCVTKLALGQRHSYNPSLAVDKLQKRHPDGRRAGSAPRCIVVGSFFAAVEP
jgi:hypothetical protein